MSLSINSAFNSSQLASNLFSKIDSKKQGYIDKSELQQAFADITGSSASDNSTDALFTKLDGDGDGKITQDELSNGLDTLAQQLFSQLQQSQMGGMGAMPPPPAEKSDAGFSKDELSAIANDSSTPTAAKDKLTSLVQNFDAADTDHDGKISAREAMAYDKSQSASSTDASSASSSSSTEQLKLMAQLMQLIRSYGGADSDASATTVTATA